MSHKEVVINFLNSINSDNSEDKRKQSSEEISLDKSEVLAENPRGQQVRAHTFEYKGRRYLYVGCYCDNQTRIVHHALMLALDNESHDEFSVTGYYEENSDITSYRLFTYNFTTNESGAWVRSRDAGIKSAADENNPFGYVPDKQIPDTLKKAELKHAYLNHLKDCLTSPETTDFCQFDVTQYKA